MFIFSKNLPKSCAFVCVCVCVFLWGSRVAVLMIQGENELHKSGRGLFVRPSFFPSSSEFGAFLWFGCVFPLRSKRWIIIILKSFSLQFELLRFCCISHAKCTWELDFGFCRLLYVDGWFFCFEDAGSLCGLCSLWVLSCSRVSPRFNAVVDVDMGILLLVLDFQVMLYLNVNCFCWAWNRKLSSSVFLLVNWGKFCLLWFQISAA